MWAEPPKTPVRAASAKTHFLHPSREWGVIQLTTEDRELPRLLDLIESEYPHVTVRICGDCLSLIRSGLKEGSYGYLFIYDPSGKYSFDLQYMGSLLHGSSGKLIIVPELEIMGKSYTRQDLQEVCLKDLPVEILDGDFRKLKGVVIDEHHFEEGDPEVDVKITTMTLTRIINVRKNQVRPLERNAS